jgi:predicted MPP superfamily phosphohydrolase
MNTPSRIIHISDIHCTTRNYITALNPGSIIIDIVTGLPLANPAAGDPQDTPAKCGELVNFLSNNQQSLRTNRIVITGDLVDSAERDDFNVYAKQYLLDPLTSNGFDVTVVPGNHDYFNDGNQFLTAHIAEGAEQFFAAFSSFMKVSGPNDYPVDLDLGNGNRLILINSLKGHYDVETDSERAQGNVGTQQQNWLRNTLPKYQQGRAAGNKIAIAMHHSPFEPSGDIELTDAVGFLNVIANQIDALMFGHTGPPHQFYLDYAHTYGIPVITSENIDNMSSDGYPISVIDLTFNEVEVYSTKHGLIRVEKGLPDTRVPVPMLWFATLPS